MLFTCYCQIPRIVKSAFVAGFNLECVIARVALAEISDRQWAFISCFTAKPHMIWFYDRFGVFRKHSPPKVQVEWVTEFAAEFHCRSFRSADLLCACDCEFIQSLNHCNSRNHNQTHDDRAGSIKDTWSQDNWRMLLISVWNWNWTKVQL